MLLSELLDKPVRAPRRASELGAWSTCASGATAAPRVATRATSS